MIELRSYQKDGLAALWNYFADGGKGNPIIAWPTGTGKSCVPAVFISHVLKQWPNQRFLMVTHVSELIKQNSEVLKYVWPTAPLGIHSAGLKKRDTAHPVIYGGIQSMIKNPTAFGHRDIMFIDEAHLVSQDESSQYLTFIQTMRLLNPMMKVIGMSATPYRMGQGMLTDQGSIFTDIVHDLTGIDAFNQLITDGYLSPLVPLRTRMQLDVSNVQIAKGEFVMSQLQSAVDKAEITYKGLQELVAAGQNRKSWLIFASGIEHAEHIAEMLKSFNVECAAVHSKQKQEYNDDAIKAFKEGRLRAIVNYGKLTTGFNHPEIDLIGMLRPTLSVPLWVQMLGRGTRPAKDKNNCIAEGSLVLTNYGLIPIEKISIDMKVWDGIEFVSHNGVIYQGEQEVIEYAGLFCTPDHKVWTKKGWQTFRECFEKRIGIAITEIGGKYIRKTENYFCTNSIQKTFLYQRSMHFVFRKIFQGLYKCYNIKSWLSQMWKTPYSSQMALCAMQCSQNALYQSKRFALFGLWRKRNTIQIFKSKRNGIMDYIQSWITQRITNRQNRKYGQLRSRQFKMVYSTRKYDKSKIIQKSVYDITNAGKFNRFTVNGLLVSNCLVMDFAKNTIRLGPINDPIIPRKKGESVGDAPVKICEHCGVYNHARVRFCGGCNAEFEFEVKIVAKASTEELLRSDFPIIETFNVERASYSKREGRDGKPAYIRAGYYCGGRTFNENVFPEGKGYARHLFQDWWKQRHPLDPPKSTDEAVQYLFQLRAPRRIRVHINLKFPQVMGAEY